MPRVSSAFGPSAKRDFAKSAPACRPRLGHGARGSCVKRIACPSCTGASATKGTTRPARCARSSTAKETFNQPRSTRLYSLTSAQKPGFHLAHPVVTLQDKDIRDLGDTAFHTGDAVFGQDARESRSHGSNRRTD